MWTISPIIISNTKRVNSILTKLIKHGNLWLCYKYVGNAVKKESSDLIISNKSDWKDD